MEEQISSDSHTRSFIQVSQQIYETRKHVSKVNVDSIASGVKADNQQIDSCG